MKRFILYAAVFTLVFSSCRKDPSDFVNTPDPEPPGKYDNGFFIVNEGWYGHGPGTLSFYSYETQSLTDSIYQVENPGKEFSASTSSLQWAKFHGGKLFLMVKVDGDVVVLDGKTMKETTRISGHDWRDFAAIDEQTALLSAGDGIYPLDLETLAAGSRIAGVDEEVNDLLVAGNYVFASTSSGVVALNKSGYTLAKKFENMDTAPVLTDDGSVWAAKNDTLFRIKTDLSTEAVPLGFSVRSNMSFALSQITAGGNAVYLVADNNYASPNNKIYKYVPGEAASLTTAFVTSIPESRNVYNRGIGFDKAKNQLDITTVGADYGPGNTTYIFDAANGNLVKSIEREGYYFPSMPLYR
ncbi:MAG: DUF5074 domain-containing protein [Mucilaginibacter polytrichastri]|nr:DUF5074 domain-containing protein [Mucilaginibacter polytrichastri]